MKYQHRIIERQIKKASPPASLNIITGLGEYAYKRADGVNVIPVTAIGV
jgi:hypothetical protein